MAGSFAAQARLPAFLKPRFLTANFERRGFSSLLRWGSWTGPGGPATVHGAKLPQCPGHDLAASEPRSPSPPAGAVRRPRGGGGGHPVALARSPGRTWTQAGTCGRLRVHEPRPAGIA
jgi:hypothetical protein